MFGSASPGEAGQGTVRLGMGANGPLKGDAMKRKERPTEAKDLISEGLAFFTPHLNRATEIRESLLGNKQFWISDSDVGIICTALGLAELLATITASDLQKTAERN